MSAVPLQVNVNLFNIYLKFTFTLETLLIQQLPQIITFWLQSAIIIKCLSVSKYDKLSYH